MINNEGKALQLLNAQPVADGLTPVGDNNIAQNDNSKSFAEYELLRSSDGIDGWATIEIDTATNQQVMRDLKDRGFILSPTGSAEYLDKR